MHPSWLSNNDKNEKQWGDIIVINCIIDIKSHFVLAVASDDDEVLPLHANGDGGF
jgi:hypothetical protein